MLYHEHGAALLAYATRLTGDRRTAEDVLQDTLLHAWRHADVIHEASGSIRAWLFTVTRNIVTDRVPMKAVRSAEASDVNEAVEATSIRDHSQRIVGSMVAFDALGQLSDDYRAVVIELYFRGLSAREAAEILSIPIGTVKSRSHRALSALRDLRSTISAEEVETGWWPAIATRDS
jgi:RNA polymerase sigma-70 factor (ECF subfamily)